MSRQYIAQTLKRLRTARGLTASEVGALVGKSGKTVSAWENNHGQPDAETLIMLCDIYQVDDILAEFREEKKSQIVLDEEISLLRELDDIDRAEIRGAMKQMLKADKYKKKAPSFDE